MLLCSILFEYICTFEWIYDMQVKLQWNFSKCEKLHELKLNNDSKSGHGLLAVIYIIKIS